MRFTIGLLGLLICGAIAQQGSLPASAHSPGLQARKGLQAPVQHPSPKPVAGEEECFDYTNPIPLGQDLRHTPLTGQQIYRHCA